MVLTGLTTEVIPRSSIRKKEYIYIYIDTHYDSIILYIYSGLGCRVLGGEKILFSQAYVRFFVQSGYPEMM